MGSILHTVVFAVLLAPLLAHVVSARSNRHPQRVESLVPGGPTDGVIIIGAGLAGATVAYELSQRNIPFLVLEAAAMPGGRTQQHLLTPTGPLVEAGANWVQGYVPGDAFSDFVANEVQLDMAITDFDDAYFVDVDGTIVPDDRADPAWRRASSAVYGMYQLLNASVTADGEILNDMTAKAALLVAGGWDRDDPLDIAAMRFELDYEYAVPPAAMSLLELTNFYSPAAPPVEDMFVNDTRGTRAIADWHLSHAGIYPHDADGPNMLLNAPVRSVTYTSSSAYAAQAPPGVVVTLRDGRQFASRAVVSTVPVGVLQEALLTNPKDDMRIDFYPPLPLDKTLAISKFELADYSKIFIKFYDAVFTENHPAFLMPLECDESGFLNVHNLNKPLYMPGENVILVTATASRSRDLLCLDESARLNTVLIFVSRALGRAVLEWEVEAWFVPGWHTNPFARGAFTTRTPGISRADYAAFNRAEGSLFFAGEAHSEQLHGYMQGAWETGKKAAADVAAFLNSTTR